MAITVTASGAQEDFNVSGGDIVLNVPTGFAATEVELRWLIGAGNGTAANLTPAVGTGFTSIGNNGTTNDYGERAVYRVHTGTPGSVTHSIAATESFSSGVAFRAQGVDTTDVLAGTGAVGEVASGTSPRTLPTITTDEANTTIVYVVFHGAGTATPTMGQTLVDTLLNDGTRDLVAVYTEEQAVAGTSTARTVSWTGGGSSPIYYAIIPLKPAGGTDGTATPAAIAVTSTIPQATDGGNATATPAAIAVPIALPAVTATGTGAPDAPAQPTVQAGPECVLIEWVEPNDNGNPITGYKVEVNINSGGWTTVAADTGNTREWYLHQGRTNGASHVYRVSAINSSGTSAASTQSAAAVPAFAALPTAVDATGRWIEDQNGDFWPMFGDAGGLWPFLANNATIVTYLDNMADRGFNLWRVEDPQNAAVLGGGDDVVTGTSAFTGTAFASTLDEAYWARREWMIAHALVRGISVLFQPIWLGFDDTEGWGNEISALTNTNLEDAGEAIGARLAPYPNLIWCFGGDRPSPSATHLARLDAFIVGVRSSLTAAGVSHLMTVHPSPDVIAADYASGHFFTGGTTLDLNGVYDNTETEVTEYPAAWADDVGPVFLLEGFYRHNPSPPTLQQMRRQHWWGLIAGCGAVMGNMDRVQWGENVLQAPDGTLAETWDDPDGDRDRDTQDFVVLIDLVTGWRYILGDTALDTTGTFLVSGASSGATGALARYGPNFGLIYMPTTRAVEIDVTEVGSVCRITRIDPVSGATSVLTSSATSSTHTVTSQGNNSSGDSDWVLVVERIAAPAAIAASLTVPAATGQASHSRSPDTVATVSAMPAVTAQGSNTATPAATVVTITIPAATGSGQTTGAAQPATIAAPASLPAATMTAGSTVTPAATSVTVTIPDVSATGSDPGTATPAVIAVTLQHPAVTVTGAGNSAPAAIPAAFTVPAVTLAAGTVVTPAVVHLAASLSQPTVVYGGTATPAAIALAIQLGAVIIDRDFGDPSLRFVLIVPAEARTHTPKAEPRTLEA